MPSNHVIYYNANSLQQVLNHLEMISEMLNSDSKISRPLWFRGHECSDYILLPTLTRNNKIKVNATGCDNFRYTETTLLEDNNLQHFVARTHDMLPDDPNRRITWQELSQHYGGQTRFLDWTESVIVALKFALKSFFQNDALSRSQGKNTPCIWILDPYGLNQEGMEQLKDRKRIETALSEFEGYSGIDVVYERVVTALNHYSKSYSIDAYKGRNIPINPFGIPSLSIIERFFDMPGKNIYDRMKHVELNPYYYMLLRQYSDGIPVRITNQENPLVPLASLQPYHSERIRAQRGVFTIFPNYVLDNDNFSTSEDPRAMENQSLCKNHLFCIRLYNPGKIRKSLELMGENLSSLYPSIENYNTENIPLG